MMRPTLCQFEAWKIIIDRSKAVVIMGSLLLFYHIGFDFARNIDCVCSLDRVATINVLSKSNLSSENSYVLHSRRSSALHRIAYSILTCNFTLDFQVTPMYS